jgi:hypothetical protein
MLGSMTDSDSQAATDATRIAIEFLTLWMERDRSRAAEHITKVMTDPDAPETAHVIAGLLNLNMFTIFELAKANNATDAVAWAGEYLRSLSPHLP